MIVDRLVMHAYNKQVKCAELWLTKHKHLVNMQTDVGDVAVVCAAAVGDIEMLQLLYDNGADLNVQDGRGQTAMIEAVRHNSRNVIDFLQRHHVAMIDTAATDGDLICAVHLGDEARVRQLVADGVDVNEIGDNNLLPLVEAVSTVCGYVGIVRFLLQSGADVNKIDGEGDSALVCALTWENAEFTRILLAAGADPNLESDNTATPLTCVAEYKRNIPLFDLLLRHGADIDAHGHRGNTPLAQAITSLEMTKYLVEQGAQVNAQCSDGQTALHRCVCSESRETEAVARYLLEKGADIIGIRDRNLNNVLTLALLTDGCEMVPLLLAHVQAHNLSFDKEDALSTCVIRGKRKSAMLLLAAGANVHGGLKGWSPMRSACCSQLENLEMIEMLLEHGANPLEKSYPRNDVFHDAIVNDQKRVVALLIRYGAKADAMYNGQSILFSVASVAMAKILIAAGADAKCLSRNGETLVSVVANRVIHELVYINNFPTNMCSLFTYLLETGADIRTVSKSAKNAPLLCNSYLKYSHIAERKRLVDLAVLLIPFKLPALVAYHIYVAGGNSFCREKECVVPRYDAWNTIVAIRNVQR